MDKMKSKKQQQGKRDKEAVKVVYISTPMKVKTSASNFRALVQELTGRYSDAERYMKINGVGKPHDQYLDHSADDYNRVVLSNHLAERYMEINGVGKPHDQFPDHSAYDYDRVVISTHLPESSESSLDTFDDLLIHMDQGFAGMFQHFLQDQSNSQSDYRIGS